MMDSPVVADICSRVSDVTHGACKSADICLNWRKCEFQMNRSKNVATDVGFDLTIPFACTQKLRYTIPIATRIFIAYRHVDGEGGTQLRVIRDDIYKLVVAQLRTLILRDARAETGKNYKYNVLFANILEGNAFQKHMPKFMALLMQPEYAAVANRIYIGDVDGYVAFYQGKTKNM